ncbi:sensor histidine kinase [Loktanella agnita]|uniref:sensor histidine kinase n=1 Tax=Loktanella agnita TaxID=287097 RepID=UPI0039890439
MIRTFFSSLRTQIVLLLTLALLPLGSIAIYQTNRVATEANNNAELALLALTESAAKEEELIIERASGAASLVAAMAPTFLQDPDRCTRDLGAYISRYERYSFIGIIPASGLMTCSSSGREYDFTDVENFQKSIEAKKRLILVNTRGAISQESVFIVSQPYYLDGNYGGFVSVSIPHLGLRLPTDDLESLGLADLITINDDTDILTARGGIEEAADELPALRTFSSSLATGKLSFRGVNQRGERRIYTVVPIKGSPATVIGVWRTDVGLAAGQATVGPAVFPVLMWIASMVVAMLALHTLVLRHISRLRKNMDTFAETRNAEAISRPGTMPAEMRALYVNFTQMTDDILREEAELEDALREKNVLIKEVHHRVKNNLQLISSIMNMKIRLAEHDETKSVLSRLQDRVLSLATIHRDLYQSQHGGMVDVGGLISDVVQKSFEMGADLQGDIDVHTDIERVLLYPDQAVPLSLMMAEAMTNTMKYIGIPASGRPWINASLKQDGKICTVTLSNSIGAHDNVESTGLGGQLINAFVIQLGGKLEKEKTDDSYMMTLTFEIEEFEPEIRDF